MMDNIRNALLIFTSASAIFITTNKFFFNLPLNIIKASYKFDSEEASFVESAVGAFIAILYGTMFVVGVASMLIAIFEKPHLASNAISELPIDKLRQNLFCAMILLISVEVILTLVLMNLKLMKKTNFIKVISKIIFILSLVLILASIALFIFECLCYKSNTTLMINSKSINLGNLNLNQIKKEDVRVYLNDNKVVSDNKEYGKLVISNSNVNLNFSINQSIKIEDYDEIKLYIKGIKTIKCSYSVANEIGKMFIRYSGRISCYVFLVISIGVLWVNEKLSKQKKYLLKTKDDTIECGWFLQYADYYFVIDGNENKYINKKDVSEIHMEQINVKKKRHGIIKQIIKNIKISKKAMTIIAIIIFAIICFISIKAMKEGNILENAIWTIVGAILGYIGSFLISWYYDKKSTTAFNKARENLNKEITSLHKVTNKIERYQELQLERWYKLDNGEYAKIHFGNGKYDIELSKDLSSHIEIRQAKGNKVQETDANMDQWRQEKINNSDETKNS